MTAQIAPPLAHIANPEDRLRQLIWLLRELEEQDIERLLFGSLGDSYPPVRQRAGRELVDRMTPRRASWLRQLASGTRPPAAPGWMPQPAPQTRQAAILALRGAPCAETLEAIAALREDPSPDVRYQSLITLFELEAPDEVMGPAVRRGIQDPDAEIAVVAAQIIADRQWSELSQAILDRRAQVYGELRLHFDLALVEVLGDQDGAIIEELTRELERGVRDEKTMAASATALVAVAMKHGQVERATKTLRAVLERWLMHPLLKVEAAAQLARMGDAQGLDYLNKSFDSRRKDARGYAIDVAGRLKLEALYGRVARVAQRAEDYHADTALLALANYATPEARALLGELAAGHATGELRDIAAQALRAPRRGGVHTFMDLDALGLD